MHVSLLLVHMAFLHVLFVHIYCEICGAHS